MNYEKVLKVVVIHIIIFAVIVMFANLTMYIDKFSDEHYTKFRYYIPGFVYFLFILSFVLSLFSTYKKSSN